MEQEWETEFANLCLSLSMDEATKQDAINKYRSAQDFNLDGKPIYWLACALYDSCFSRQLVTISGESQRGNYISFTQLLKTIGLSFEDFVHKYLDVWQITANRTDDFRNHVESLRRRWIVTSQIYNKYKQIFEKIGKSLPDSNFRIKRKARREVTSTELYKFIWTFYCNVKAAFPNSIDEVVSSSLLLCAVTDYCFHEVYLSDPNLLTEDGRNAFKQSENNSIIDRMCCDFIKMESTEAKRIRDYHLKPLLKQYFIKGVLKAGLDNDRGIFESSVFDSNHKSINNEYDAYFLKQGEYDNRLFLENSLPPTRSIGDRTPSKLAVVHRTPSELSHKVKRNLLKQLEESMIPQTPLSNRNYLPVKTEEDFIKRTPISEQADILNRLNLLIHNYRTEPSPDLEKILRKFEPKIREDIMKIQKKLSDKFIEAYSNGEQNAMVFAEEKLESGVKLFYRMFELIVISEADRRCSDIALRNIVSNVDFISATFVISLEIVLNSYGSSDRKFPWILNALGLHSFMVGKVIETIIMHDTGLSRTIIKHLNTIEETMLETMVWAKDSPLYDQLAECNPPRPPRYEDVKPSKGLGNQTPTMRIPSGDGHRFATMNSSSTLMDRKRGLTPLSSTGSPFLQIDKRHTAAQPNFKIAMPTFAQPAVETSSATREGAQTPVSALATNMDTMGVMSPPPRPLLRKSLQMFFRKIYNLVSLRIRNLVEKLDLAPEVLQKIWTVFEHAMTNHVHLFHDRHIDQIMISSTYLIVKAEDLKITFRQIIECYRQQPQVQNKQYVYRNVPLETRPLPQTLMCTCKGKVSETASERGDIIKFYNSVFINHISNFIKPAEGQGGKLNLSAPGSPMPHIYSLTPGNVFSPRRIDSHNLTVSPKKTSTIKPYVFGESPTKDIDAMNERVQNIQTRGQKRMLFKNDEEQKKSEKVKKSAAFLQYDN